MPRRDGYPTNQELLADFTNASHEAFMTLYEIHMQDALPLAYEGKPLQTLGARITKRYFEAERPADSVASEALRIEMLSTDDVNFMEDSHLHMRHFPPDVFEYYRSITNHIARVALTNMLPLREHLPSAGIVSDYTARFPNNSTRHVNTLKEKPAKMTITSARFLVEEVQHYAASGQSQMHPIERLEQAYCNNEEGVMTHHFTIAMDAHLPLNGYENTDFIIHYRDTMITSLQKEERNLEKMKHLGAPQDYLDYMILRIDTFRLAAERAQAILDQR